MTAPKILAYRLYSDAHRHRWSIRHAHPSYGEMVSRGCARTEAQARGDLMFALWLAQMWAPR